MNHGERDRNMMEEALAAQNNITARCSNLSNQCGATPVKMAFLNLLGDEHRIQHELFSELHRRGWKTEERAAPSQLREVCQWAKDQGGVEGPVLRSPHQ